MSQATIEERFVRGEDGRFYDTQIDPKVLRAQEAAQKKQASCQKRAPTTGFTQPSEHDLRQAQKEKSWAH